jgi:hypothetical protein
MCQRLEADNVPSAISLYLGCYNETWAKYMDERLHTIPSTYDILHTFATTQLVNPRDWSTQHARLRVDGMFGPIVFFFSLLTYCGCPIDV